MHPRPYILTLGLVAAMLTVLPSGPGRMAGPTMARAANTPPKVANPHGDYQEDCSLCHSAKAWKPAKISKKFDHERFLPLAGAHAAVACTQCHKSLDFAMAPTACVDCHADVHSGELGTDCARCHSTRSFVDRDDQVRLHRLTRFPLAGAHSTLDCEMCHALASPDAFTYVNTSTDCVSCHMDDYTGTTDPDHEAVGLPQDCTQCHGQTTWAHASFDHAHTGFPLTGAHAPLPCERCHVGGVFTGLTSACVSCHQSDYNGTNDPNHAASGFSTTCETCHNTSRWGDANFNHNASRFPLTGAHRTVACNDCHGGGVYTGLPTACVSCHQSDYNGASPNHVASGFPTDCVQCHTTTRWDGATFNHSTTQFPLTGAHTSAACNDCHGGGVYSGLPTACVSCHQSDYNGASPNHVASGFPTDCVQCHTTTRWDGANFNHSTTQFPLTGAHTSATCNDCHGGGVYSGLPTACVSCHQSDYNGASPNHAASGFSTDCTDCHTTTRWDGANFNHSTTQFPLTGAHTSATCNDCHGGGVYSGLPSTCISCHQSDYNGASPNHAAAGFPTDCTDCHSTTRWDGATFDHSTFFPIASGRHSGNACSECHNNAANYSDFNCLGCHPHSDKAETDGHHRGENNYSYTSAACYDCHPRGNS